ncbi:MAG: hypothetical protein P8H90_09840 [Tateyamaria sp.]|nr:hypothetical protein [Tateyamaria sp.]MDG2377396.1 hypothetical protein [Tateyamaria sp.]
MGSTALTILAQGQTDGFEMFLIIAGAMSYIVGVFTVTGIQNIPVNQSLYSSSRPYVPISMKRTNRPKCFRKHKPSTRKGC